MKGFIWKVRFKTQPDSRIEPRISQLYDSPQTHWATWGECGWTQLKPQQWKTDGHQETGTTIFISWCSGEPWVCLASRSDIQICSVQSKSFLLRTYNEKFCRLRENENMKSVDGVKRDCIKQIILLLLYNRVSSWLFTWPFRRYCSFGALSVFKKK